MRRTLLAAGVLFAACQPPGLPGPSQHPQPPPEQQPPVGTGVEVSSTFRLKPGARRVTVLKVREAGPVVREQLTVAADLETLEVKHTTGEAIAVNQSELTAAASVQQEGCLAIAATSSAVINVPADQPTLQQAIDAAKPGDTVLVAPGVYTEHVKLKHGIALLGSGAAQTVLDGRGLAENLVDFTDATGVTIAGFTLRNVGRASGCSRPEDPFSCSGNWYAAAIYADGHSFRSSASGSGVAQCTGSSAFIMHNVFESNDIAVMLYFHAFAVVQNNVFVHNASAYIANHLQDQGVVLHNTFVGNAQHSVGITAGYVDVVNNIIVDSGEAYRSQYVQRGRVKCNAFFANVLDEKPDYSGATPRFTIGTDGNLAGDPRFAAPAARDFRLSTGSVAQDTGCSESGVFTDPDGSPVDMGAYGGAAGRW